MAGGTESNEKVRGLKRLNAWRKRHAEWYNSLPSYLRITASIAISLAIGAGFALGGLPGTAVVGLMAIAKIYTGNALLYKIDEIASEMAGDHKITQYLYRGGAAVLATVLLAFGGYRIAMYLMEHGLDFSLDPHGFLGDAAGTSEVIPMTQAQIDGYEKAGYRIHKVGDTYFADKNGTRFTWNGKNFGEKGFPIPKNEIAAAGVAGAGNGFNAENVSWLKSVGLNGSQIDALRAYGISDAKIDEWQAEGRVPHIDLRTAELTSTKDGVTTVWDPKTQEWKPKLQAPTAAPAPEAAAETAATKTCTGLAAVVESKGAHGCDGSEALLMDLARKLVAAGATADTYEQGTVLDRLVEAQLNGNVARMASVLSQELGMYNPGDHLDSANIWDNARLRVEGTKLTLVGPGTGPNGDLLVDCTKIDGFDGKMIHTTACGEAPAAPAPAPEAPVVTAEVAPEPEVVPPPPEVVPAPTPVPPPEVVPPPAEDCYPDQVSRVSVEDSRLGVRATYPAFEYRGETPAEARTWIEQYFAQHPPQRETTVLLMVDEDCDGHPEYIKCVHIRPDGSVRYTDMMSNSSSIADSRFDRDYNSFGEDTQRRILARDFDRVPGTTTDLRGVAATDPTPDGKIDLPEHESNAEPVASPYAAEAAPDPVDANTALVRLGESFDAIPAIDAKIQLIGKYDIQSIMNLDANQIPGLSADQKEAWTAVRRVLLEGRNSGVVPGRGMSLSAFMQQVMGVTATNTD